MDLPTFVDNIRFLRGLMTPAKVYYDCLLSCYRWDHPNTNIILLLFLNGMWYQSSVFSALALMTVFYSCVFVMSLNIDRPRKQIPDSNPAQIKELKEIYGEFYQSILLINSFVLAVTNLIVTTFLIIRWEDPSKSIKAHVKIIFYGLLIYASLTYSNIILLNVVMLHNLPACLGPWAHMEVFSKGLEAEDAKVDETLITPSCSSLPKKESAIEAESMPSEPLEQCGESSVDTVKTSDQCSDQYCHGCDTSFGYILNRRHYCRHCGDHFCANCCNKYVPRYFFGATAPAAKTEKVMVCARCFEYLSEKLDKQSSMDDTVLTETDPNGSIHTETRAMVSSESIPDW